MAKERTTLEKAMEADSLYETAITRWVEQQPELAAKAKQIMDDVTDCFDPEVAEVLIKMRSLPSGEFMDWYNKQYCVTTQLTQWYLIVRGFSSPLSYNEEKRTWHKNPYKGTVYHSVSAAELVLPSIERPTARIAKVSVDGYGLSLSELPVSVENYADQVLSKTKR
ncbi:hypothetical protein [Aeromonas veronii]|uniref:hypothetical protein n=1 Tax=Aeromonas veronii TaxID=654 RepID=UPI0011773666|nr:hypothetical protein [Aeromonas veronii]